MSDVQATFFATLVDEWARGGITDAVVCPGNRSTLLAAILESNERIRVHAMVDERSASFFALGLGLATGRPAMFWCTSGTAAVEAHAAVIEAHQAQVPLLVCTADRPPELHHARDWQSIEQSNLYGKSTRWAYDAGVASGETSSYWRSIAARSVLETLHNPVGPGPVHLNLPIREPWRLDVGALPPGRDDAAPWHTHHGGPSVPPVAVVSALVRPGRRGVIVAGRSSADPDAIHRCAEALGWPVLAEARSGARTLHANTVAAADAIVRSPGFADAHRPDVVLRIGTPVLSKAVSQWVAAAHAEEWLVDSHDVWQGPAPDATNIVTVDPTAFCDALTKAASGPPDSNWLEAWVEAERRAQAAISSVIGTGQLSEPGIARAVVRAVPPESVVFAATSMPVRDIEAYSEPREGVAILANRGASGMDGITSTAAAVSVARACPVALVIGDLSFLYDLNALWVVSGAAAPVNLVLVVVDNAGGGIFSTLPQLGDIDGRVFERVVATPHGVDIPAVVRAFGIPVVQAETPGDVSDAVVAAMAAGGLRLVYARTQRDESAALRARITDAVAAAVGAP